MFENLCHVLAVVNIGGGMCKECIQILYAVVVLVFLWKCKCVK